MQKIESLSPTNYGAFSHTNFPNMDSDNSDPFDSFICYFGIDLALRLQCWGGVAIERVSWKNINIEFSS